jgi:hypothetical protein
MCAERSYVYVLFEKCFEEWGLNVAISERTFICSKLLLWKLGYDPSQVSRCPISGVDHHNAEMRSGRRRIGAAAVLYGCYNSRLHSISYSDLGYYKSLGGQAYVR